MVFYISPSLEHVKQALNNQNNIFFIFKFLFNTKRPFVCVVASAFEATTANIMFGNIKKLKITGGTHANSRFERDIVEAAPGCFLKFCIRVHNAIHLHCARKQCNSLALSRTVQFTCTVNSASELHCSGDYFLFIYLLCVQFLYIYIFKKLVLHCYVNNIFFPEKLVQSELNSLVL